MYNGEYPLFRLNPRRALTVHLSLAPSAVSSPSADIVSACFALPFERRLLLGTEDGRILLVNYVTGAILDESHPHSAEVR